MARTIDESLTATEGTVKITVKADALEVDLDPKVLCEGPAVAIAKAIGDGIRRVSVRSANGKHARWNVTGKLASTLRAERRGKSYVITAAPDRLQDDELVKKLELDVPELENPLTADVDRAIEAVLGAIFTVKRR
jgi:hypothetical protein